MTAYDVLYRNNIPSLIDERSFYKLIKEFQESYFQEIQYREKLSKHRRPVTFLNELLQGKNGKDGVYNYLLKIQGREEMRDVDDNCSGYVNSKIEELWHEDKNLRTLYAATVAYSKLRSKDVTKIAVHVAEYRAINKVAKKIQRTIAQYSNSNGRLQFAILKAGDIITVDPNLNKANYYRFHINEMETIRKRFEVVHTMTKDDAKRYDIEFEEGIPISSIPRPQNHQEAYKLFTGFNGETICSYNKNVFFQKFGSWDLVNIEAEIVHLEKFISIANGKGYKDAVEAANGNGDNDHYCYLRLKNNYYLSNPLTENDMVFNSRLSSVYGKYFLFYEYLNKLLPKKKSITSAQQETEVEELMIPTITYSSNNSIAVQGKTYYFPFDCYDICKDIMLLREEIVKPTVSAITLQEFPEQIFNKELFTGHYDLAAVVYNIIETIVEDAQNTIHHGKAGKAKLFDGFLTICKEFALNFKHTLNVNNRGSIVETIQLLQKYPGVYACYQSALDKISKSIYERNALDDLRLSLELLLKSILNNHKSLENQFSELAKYQQAKGLSSELINMFNRLLDYYSKYQNNYVKHNNNVNRNEIGLILDLTSTFIKHLVL